MAVTPSHLGAGLNGVMDEALLSNLFTVRSAAGETTLTPTPQRDPGPWHSSSPGPGGKTSSYELTWLGVPVIQLPEDMVMVQELIWKVRPDIVETGVAHSGALALYASMLDLLGRRTCSGSTSRSGSTMAWPSRATL